jgi:Amidohydrolase family
MTDRMEFQEIEEKKCAMRGMKLFAMSFEVVAMAVLLLLGLCSALPAHAQGYDLVINNGRVIDPESKLDAVRSIGIRAGKIAAISDTPLSGKKTIDGKGLVVVPGFIDLHAHAVLTLAGARMEATDGVTTALELELGALPVGKSYDRMASKGRPVNFGFSVSWLFARGIVAQGTPIEDFSPDDWAAVMQRTNWQGYFPPEKSKQVLDLIDQGLREGALGVGASLGYMPDANREELYDIALLTKKYGDSPTYVHIRRNEPYGPNSNLGGHEEVIAVAAMTGAHMHFCHLNSNATRHIPEMIAAVEEARRLGVNITWEAYPYGAASTVISAAFLRPESLADMGIKSTDILYLKTGERVATNERLAQIQKEDPSGFAIAYLLNEDDPKDKALLDQAVVHPDSAIATDAIPWQVGPDFIFSDVWPLPADAVSHPRSAGTHARILGRYVRTGQLSMMDAISKMSLIPAQILEPSVPQMKNKGRIKVGADSDITIFDAATVIDRATYQKPNQTSAGIRYVIVNGVPVVSEGELIPDAKPGQPIRRPSVVEGTK